MAKKDYEDAVIKQVQTTINRLNEVIKDGGIGKRTPWATATLAKLRRAVGSSPNDSPDVWAVTLANCHGDFKMEWAVHTTLTLYALHQQGNNQSVCDKSVPFGKAVRAIIEGDNNREQGVIRRFNSLVTADTPEEVAVHARGLVQLIKQADIKMDYPGFAKDLYDMQFESQTKHTKLRWGRDFYYYNKEEEK